MTRNWIKQAQKRKGLKGEFAYMEGVVAFKRATTLHFRRIYGQDALYSVLKGIIDNVAPVKKRRSKKR